MPGLPAPLTTTDELLVAVHTELVGLRADLQAAARGGETAQPHEPGRLELTEPAPRPARGRKTTDGVKGI